MKYLKLISLTKICFLYSMHVHILSEHQWFYRTPTRTKHSRTFHVTLVSKPWLEKRDFQATIPASLNFFPWFRNHGEICVWSSFIITLFRVIAKPTQEVSFHLDTFTEGMSLAEVPWNKLGQLQTQKQTRIIIASLFSDACLEFTGIANDSTSQEFTGYILTTLIRHKTFLLLTGKLWFSHTLSYVGNAPKWAACNLPLSEAFLSISSNCNRRKDLAIVEYYGYERWSIWNLCLFKNQAGF